jgi:RimJ/RimL family protein N-acetyltransferase
MAAERVVLEGGHVRLEPLDFRHVDALVAAAAAEPSLYQWSAVPQGQQEMTRYIDTALEWQAAGSAVPFAIVGLEDNAVIGSTRYFDMERWGWPKGHARHGGGAADACEIGYTWLTISAIRTAANTEAKLLMLAHAFESWKMLRVCLHTDKRNQRSRAAIERIGGQFEGFLRAHRLATDLTPRDSARYSIVAAEWPAVKARLENLIAAHA